MIAVESPKDFEAWRKTVRGLLAENVAPNDVAWCSHGQQSLFKTATLGDYPARIRVPKDFVRLARLVACHTDSSRWELLHRILWRLTHGEPNLLEVSSEPAVRSAHLLAKAVGRDIHKMHAFVRFKKVTREGVEHFVAWYKPDFHILRLASPFFVKRFGAMRWAILTPIGSVAWDLSELRFTDETDHGLERPPDDFEKLWKTYYKSIFNPARSNRKMMTKEMPRRFWKELPEAETIDGLLRASSGRVEKMIDTQAPAARYELNGKSIEELRKALPQCRACPLFASANHAVAGEGPSDASMVFVGEQPGDEEDLSGRPFVGPAGKILEKAFLKAGIRRESVYLTNAVKHFKYELRGKVRLHKRANAEEARSCHQWLEAELSALKPQVIVALGRTAAQSLLGRAIQIGAERGKVHQSPFGPVVITYHPSALLRAPDQEAQQKLLLAVIEDLHLAAAQDESKENEYTVAEQLPMAAFG